MLESRFSGSKVDESLISDRPLEWELLHQTVEELINILVGFLSDVGGFDWLEVEVIVVNSANPNKKKKKSWQWTRLKVPLFFQLNYQSCFEVEWWWLRFLTVRYPYNGVAVCNIITGGNGYWAFYLRPRIRPMGLYKRIIGLSVL